MPLGNWGYCGVSRRGVARLSARAIELLENDIRQGNRYLSLHFLFGASFFDVIDFFYGLIKLGAFDKLRIHCSAVAQPYQGFPAKYPTLNRQDPRCRHGEQGRPDVRRLHSFEHNPFRTGKMTSSLLLWRHDMFVHQPSRISSFQPSVVPTSQLP